MGMAIDYRAARRMAEIYKRCNTDVKRLEGKKILRTAAIERRSVAADMFSAYLQEKVCQAYPGVGISLLSMIHLDKYIEITDPQTDEYDTDAYIIANTMKAIELVQQHFSQKRMLLRNRTPVK